MKFRFYIPDSLEGVDLVSFFTSISEDVSFWNRGKMDFFERNVEQVPVENAQAILLKNNFKNSSPVIEAYIKKYADLGEKYNIPVFIFSFADFSDNVRFDPRVRIFRLSAYHSTLQPQDIIMPTSAEDHGKEMVVPSPKRLVPIVSFCGMGGFQSVMRWIKYSIKIFIFTLQSVVDSRAQARKIGVYWRRAMMRACRKSSLVATNFIIRRSFSGLRTTIEIDPEIARNEFVQSIVDADFVLTPKGDGNYSNRFIETLSLGRIPVLVDTEVVLPLEDEVDYSKVVVRVPMKNVKKTPRYIRDFYDHLTDEEWRSRQLLARETFEQYLKQDVFFQRFFAKEFP